MVFASLNFESKLWDSGKTLICGIDEVGRGCFAGPVVIGAVVFSKKDNIPEGLADSKLLKPTERVRLSKLIQESASCFAIAEIDVNTINRVGIGEATQIGFRKVLTLLTKKPDHLLIDAFLIKDISKEIQTPIIHGDRLSASIAAASIIAKVYRDDLMVQLDKQYPGYGFSKHKGYGTKEHQEAIHSFGLSKLHRTSFNLSKFT